MAYALIKSGGIGENFGTDHKEFMVDGSNDFANIDMADVAPGSMAYTPNFDGMWVVNMNKEWATVISPNTD